MLNSWVLIPFLVLTMQRHRPNQGRRHQAPGGKVRTRAHHV